MGYLFNIYGIGASIAAHFIFDLIMFVAVIRGKG
jgi:hypothetical protein